MSADPDARIRERTKICRIESLSYEIWLRSLTPANFLLVGVGGSLSFLAGLSIVTELDLVGVKVAGWAAVVGALLTGLHSLLKCDPHQEQCRRLAGRFEELRTEYELVQLETDEEVKARLLRAVEQKLVAARAGRAGVLPSKRSVDRARLQVEAEMRLEARESQEGE